MRMVLERNVRKRRVNAPGPRYIKSMSMIRCAECTQPISTTAATCPHCGAPAEIALAKAEPVDTEVLPELLDEAVRAASMWPEGELSKEHLAGVEQLRRLKMLGLSRTGLTDVHLLVELKGLRYLYLEKNGLKQVRALCELKNLKQVWLYGNSVPQEELLLVEQALPKCEIFI